MPRKGKCFSTCRKRLKSVCDPPECHYTNGNKYKYCRLSFTRKMNKDCVPLRKKPSLTPSERPITKSPITKSPITKSPITSTKSITSTNSSLSRSNRDYEKHTSEWSHKSQDLHPTKEDIAEFREKYTKRAATRKIGKFLRRTDPRVRSKFLQSVCSDAGVCIAFGTNASAIRKHFDNFNNFNLLSQPAERIGNVSANGFVKELTYKHRGYVANAVLKSSVKSNADNLLYEALVGFFLNKMSNRYPTFVETYGLYQYNSSVAYLECKDNKLSDPAILSVGLNRISESAKDVDTLQVQKSCLTPISMAVLIQHLKSAKTLFEKCADQLFVEKDLLYVLYQVYMTLASLSDVFTHYDLHRENVLVYEPVAGSHIEYHYHVSTIGGNRETVFRSKYIAKIIDYGRCYFKDEGSSNFGESKRFYDKLVCKECKPKCGKGKGYEWMEYKAKAMKDSTFICSQRVNPSHDLRLLYSIGTKVKGMDLNLQTLIGRVVYGQGVTKGKEMFGTEPRPDSGYPIKINNINDAFSYFEDIVKSPESEVANEIEYRGSKKLGELHIYGDKPMRWIPVKG